MLEVRDVSVFYGKIQALRGVSLDVARGEVVALIGSNGAGKSTLLRTVAGVLAPRTGTIVFERTPIAGVAAHRAARLGLRLVPEGRGLLTRMTVLDNLLMGQYLRPRDAEAARDVEAVLERFPLLRERQAQVASTLSGGEQQMLAIARALVGRPQLLMLDEPSLGLAPLIVSRIFDVIRSIKDDGVTILLVEQNAKKALQIADRAYILETGQVTLAGPARDLLQGEAVQRAYLGRASG
jgi:branched-chain amino acid transport system ATP-binding protein